VRNRLGIVVSHPIQYQTPMFQALARHPNIDPLVLYCHRALPHEQADAGFGVPFDWDVPLFEGYSYRFLDNIARKPDLGSFRGLDTPHIDEIIRRENFDAVLVSGWHFKSYWQAIRSCWKSRTPVMVRGDSHLHVESSSFRRLVKGISHRCLLRRFDACLAVGKWSAEYFRNYGVRPERIFVVPHAPDRERILSGWRQERLRVLKIRESWGLPENHVVFLFAGKFVVRKRPLDFIEAIHRAASRGSPVRGLMVGDGPLRAACEREAARLDAPVRFAGFLNQTAILQAYASADVLVLPSSSETWGLVVNEAMICGLPCMVSDRVGCGPDLIQSGETGWVFPAEDVSRLADAMEAAARGRAATADMGCKARVLSASFSPEIAADQVAQAIRSIAVRRR
jgi:glycosyltransferase involved in cell wall biosynthesis